MYISLVGNGCFQLDENVEDQSSGLLCMPHLRFEYISLLYGTESTFYGEDNFSTSRISFKTESRQIVESANCIRKCNVV